MAAEVLTTEQVAEILQISVVTLEQHRAKKQGLPYVRLRPGRTIRYLRADIDSYLFSQTVVPEK